MRYSRQQLEAIANAFTPYGIAMLKERYDALYRMKHHVPEGQTPYILQQILVSLFSTPGLIKQEIAPESDHWEADFLASKE